MRGRWNDRPGRSGGQEDVVGIERLDLALREHEELAEDERQPIAATPLDTSGALAGHRGGVLHDAEDLKFGVAFEGVVLQFRSERVDADQGPTSMNVSGDVPGEARQGPVAVALAKAIDVPLDDLDLRTHGSLRERWRTLSLRQRRSHPRAAWARRNATRFRARLRAVPC